MASTSTLSMPRSNKIATTPNSQKKVQSRTLDATRRHGVKSSGIEVNQEDSNATREAERLNNILGNLSIKFLSCTFTYKDAHLSVSSKPKEKSRWKKWKANSKATLQRLGEIVGVEESEFKNCIYLPKSEEEQIQQFVRKNFTDTKIKFENCKFIKRSSTFFEKVAIKLRGVFGIIFELTYPDSSAVVDEYTFRLKDISVITTYVQERIVDKG